MTQIYSFPPVVSEQVTRLILGSMPGRQSLRQNQYYAHPQNQFWKIMAALCGFDASAPYQARCDALLDAGVALWDVAACCERPSSLDADIVAGSVIPNDFLSFFSRYPQITHIYFNGRKAAQLFSRHVLSVCASQGGFSQGEFSQGRASVWPKQFLTLPSTSPAHAARSLQDKQTQWQLIFS